MNSLALEVRPTPAQALAPVSLHSLPPLLPPAPPHPAYAPAPYERPWMACVLDEIDYGMVLVDVEARVLHANQAARAELHQDHPLVLRGDEVEARRPADALLLRNAITDACGRSLRRLLTLGEEPQRASIAVVPLRPSLPGDASSREASTLLILGKKRVCENLSVHWFARSYGLTSAETSVLQHLCSGADPVEIAQAIGVSIATVRTQLGSVRSKTGANSLRALMRQVAVLPPLVSVLRGFVH